MRLLRCDVKEAFTLSSSLSSAFESPPPAVVVSRTFAESIGFPYYAKFVIEKAHKSQLKQIALFRVRTPTA